MVRGGQGTDLFLVLLFCFLKLDIINTRLGLEFFVLTKNESTERRAKRAFLEGKGGTERGEGGGKRVGLRPEILDDLVLATTKDARREGDRGAILGYCCGGVKQNSVAPANG